MRLVPSLVAAAIVACHPSPAPAPYDVVTTFADAGDVCANACDRLWTFGCIEAQPTPAGESCASFCERNASLLNAVCVARADSAESVRACGVCR